MFHKSQRIATTVDSSVFKPGQKGLFNHVGTWSRGVNCTLCHKILATFFIFCLFVQLSELFHYQVFLILVENISQLAKKKEKDNYNFFPRYLPTCYDRECWPLHKTPPENIIATQSHLVPFKLFITKYLVVKLYSTYYNNNC